MIYFKEQANLNLLMQRINKSAEISKGVDNILKTFEKRLSRLEDTILPVYNETENLHKTKQSILQINEDNHDIYQQKNSLIISMVTTLNFRIFANMFFEVMLLF